VRTVKPAARPELDGEPVWVVASALTGRPVRRWDPYPCLCPVWSPQDVTLPMYQAARKRTGKCHTYCPCRDRSDTNNLPRTCCGWRASAPVSDVDYEAEFARRYRV
jgi:hypothetical protein